ncbi:hypothetical protein, partial [Burkholderia gladioli]|uniref:hypothetical protein n=1 Tax=Burkholderia gladioli TaxID=28095 RepID=UPI001E61BAD5
MKLRRSNPVPRRTPDGHVGLADDALRERILRRSMSDARAASSSTRRLARRPPSSRLAALSSAPAGTRGGFPTAQASIP